MAHTYADVASFKNFLLSDGVTDFGTVDDGAILRVLEGSSRRVDGFTGRTRSGFGPRIASNVYDHDGSDFLDLDDDFIAVTSVTSAASTGEAAGTLVADDDYLTRPTFGPIRELIFPGLGTSTIGSGYGVITAVGTAGYSLETVNLGTMGTVTASATAGTLTAGLAYPGMTLLADAEQMYVTAATGGTALTLVRGVNGTTAAVHAASTTVYQYRYDRAVELATHLVAQRRWRQKEAGVTGDFGGGAMPFGGHRDTERSILNAEVGHLRLFEAM